MDYIFQWKLSHLVSLQPVPMSTVIRNMLKWNLQWGMSLSVNETWYRPTAVLLQNFPAGLCPWARFMPLVFILLNGSSYHKSGGTVQRDLADNGVNVKIFWVKVWGIQRMQHYRTKHIAYQKEWSQLTGSNYYLEAYVWSTENFWQQRPRSMAAQRSG